MKAFRRFLLLASFAAIGIGLAVGVIVTTRAGAPIKAEASSRLASQAAPADDRPDRPHPSESAKTAGQSNPTDAAPDRELPLATRAGLKAVRPHPAVASQFAQEELPEANSPGKAEPAGPELTPVPPPSQSSPRMVQAANPFGSPEQIPVPANPNLVPSPPAAAVPVIGAPAPTGRARFPAQPAPSLPVPPPAVALPARAASSMLKVETQDTGKLKIHIQNAELREVLDMLAEQGKMNILAGKEVQGKVSVALEGVDIESALDAVLKSTGYAMRRQGKFIFVGSPDEFNSVEQALDRVGTRVFRPNYVSAAELKNLIQPLLTEKVGMVSVSSAAEVGIAANDASAGGDKYAGGDVVLVRDYQAVLSQIDQVVAEVDVRPLQVSIEAMVMSVKLNDSCKFGVDFALLQNYMKFGWGTPAESLTKLTFDQGGLKFGYLDGNVGVFVNALESIGDTDVIAKPRVMVLNKHRAEILIGDKKGYVSTTVTETASTQTVDFLETGVQLRLRPFISRDGVIRMEVHPELSDGDVKVSGNFTLPNKSVTEVTSNIMVRDGCTVVIGGLIRDQKTVSTQAIPYFGSMPYVGFLFRDKSETIEREELIVLITPRIVYEPATCVEGKKDQCLFERRHDIYADKMSPLGRRSIARRYLHLAQGCYEQGDQRTALRFAELAVHFDPQSNDAIELRESIAKGLPPGASIAPPMAGPLPAHRGGVAAGKSPEVADWMLEDLRRDGPPPAAAMPLHPYDPGQPGTRRDILRPRQLP